MLPQVMYATVLCVNVVFCWFCLALQHVIADACCCWLLFVRLMGTVKVAEMVALSMSARTTKVLVHNIVMVTSDI